MTDREAEREGREGGEEDRSRRTASFLLSFARVATVCDFLLRRLAAVAVVALRVLCRCVFACVQRRPCW